MSGVVLKMTRKQKVKNSPEQKRGIIIRQIKNDVTRMNTTTTHIAPSLPPEKQPLPSLGTPREASIYQKPAVHQNGWFITTARMFQRAEGRAILLVYNAIGGT